MAGIDRTLRRVNMGIAVATEPDLVPLLTHEALVAVERWCDSWKAAGRGHLRSKT
jgi:hypothetical protein